MIKNKFNFRMLVSYIILGNLLVMNKAVAMDERFQQDVQNNQRLGRGTPTPLPREEVTRPMHGGIQDPTLERQIDGQAFQPTFDPSNIPPRPMAMRQTHGGTVNPKVKYDQQGQEILDQQQFNFYETITPEPVLPWKEEKKKINRDAFYDPPHAPSTHGRTTVNTSKEDQEIHSHGKRNKLYPSEH